MGLDMSLLKRKKNLKFDNEDQHKVVDVKVGSKVTMEYGDAIFLYEITSIDSDEQTYEQKLIDTTSTRATVGDEGFGNFNTLMRENCITIDGVNVY